MTTAFRSATTGRPLGLDAATDYRSRLRRLETLLQAPVENAPPEVLLALAEGLRRDPRVVATVPVKVIGDIGVALRAYAGFLAERHDTVLGSTALDRRTILQELLASGFVVGSLVTAPLIRLRRQGLTVYLRSDDAAPLVIHPFLETTAGAALRYWHDPLLRDFPTQTHDGMTTHYGIALGFPDLVALRRFIPGLLAALATSDPVLPDYTVAEAAQIPETETITLMKARRGQGRFRADLLNMWNWRCSLTGVSRPGLLRASHIKPWHESSDQERLDPFNGLLLAVPLDALFDQALITFEESGALVISGALSDRERQAFGLALALPRLLLASAHLEYMRHHRARFAAAP